MKQDVLFEVRNISKNFGGNAALKSVNMHVGYGEIVGLVGENGAGKSTTLNAALGLIHADAGSVEILGEQTLDAALSSRSAWCLTPTRFPMRLRRKS